MSIDSARAKSIFLAASELSDPAQQCAASDKHRVTEYTWKNSIHRRCDVQGSTKMAGNDLAAT
jgi:hypothetical protein